MNCVAIRCVDPTASGLVDLDLRLSPAVDHAGRSVENPHDAARGASHDGAMKLEEIQRDAMQLPDAERAALAAELLGSLPAVLWEDDLGVAETRRRSAELAQDSSMGRSREEVRASLTR